MELGERNPGHESLCDTLRVSVCTNLATAGAVAHLQLPMITEGYALDDGEDDDEGATCKYPLFQARK
jgi:hypothetical protein